MSIIKLITDGSGAAHVVVTCVVGVVCIGPMAWARNVYSPPMIFASAINSLNAFGGVLILSGADMSIPRVWTEVVMGHGLSVALACCAMVGVAAVVFPQLATRKVRVGGCAQPHCPCSSHF